MPQLQSRLEKTDHPHVYEEKTDTAEGNDPGGGTSPLARGEFSS